MKNRIICVTLSLLMIGSGLSFVFADEDIKNAELSNEYGLSSKAVDFLEAHDVDMGIFQDAEEADMSEFTVNTAFQSNVISDPGNLNEAVEALIDQVEAYEFTSEQVQEFVQGLVETPTTAVGGEPSIRPMVDRPSDDGIGYEVRSKEGYYETTAFAKIPRASRGDDPGASSYMFYTVGGKIDVGIWYSYGDRGTGWRYFYTYENQSLETGYDIISQLTAGKNVYFHANVVDNNWIRFRVLDASNFSKVYVDISVYSGGKNITKTNADWNRQITLCRKNKKFTNGAYLEGAEFSQAYIYKTNGTNSLTNANNTTSQRGAFGTNAATRDQVNADGSIPWYYDKVSIYF